MIEIEQVSFTYETAKSGATIRNINVRIAVPSFKQKKPGRLLLARIVVQNLPLSASRN